MGLDLVSWFVEDQISEYDEYWKWECFSKAVSFLVFGVDAREFHIVCYDVFVEKLQSYFVVFCAFCAADAVTHLNAGVVVFPDCHGNAWLVDVDFFAEVLDVDGFLYTFVFGDCIDFGFGWGLCAELL